MIFQSRLKIKVLHLLTACFLAASAPAQANLSAPVTNQEPATALAGPRPILMLLDYAETKNRLSGINEEIKTLKSVLVNTQVIENPDGHLIQQIAESVAADPLCVAGAGTLVWYSGHAPVVQGAVNLLGANEKTMPLETVLQALGRAKCAVLLVIDAGNDDYSQPISVSENVSILWPAKKGQKAFSNQNGSVISRTFAAVLSTKPGQDWAAQSLGASQKARSDGAFHQEVSAGFLPKPCQKSNPGQTHPFNKESHHAHLRFSLHKRY